MSWDEVPWSNKEIKLVALSIVVPVEDISQLVKKK